MLILTNNFNQQNDHFKYCLTVPISANNFSTTNSLQNHLMIHHLLNHTYWCPEHLAIALSTLAEDGLWKYSSQSRPAGTSHSIPLFDKIDSQFTIFLSSSTVYLKQYIKAVMFWGRVLFLCLCYVYKSNWYKRSKAILLPTWGRVFQILLDLI